jgi:hypothetical protein
MALTTIPAAGAKLRAATLSAMVTELRPIYVRKASDQTQSATTVLLNDTELFVSVEASLTYEFQLVVVYEAGTTADYKWALTFPAGATCSWGAHFVDTALAYLPVGFSSYTSGTGTGIGGAGIGSARATVVNGNLVTGASAGTFRYQWAQNTSTVENTKTAAGSMLVLRRLA